MLCNTRSILLSLVTASLAGTMMEPGLLVSHNIHASALQCVHLLLLPSAYLVLFGAGHDGALNL
jgi:hypothetical protein